MTALLTIPEELRSRPQWVAYSLEERGGKLTKIPKNPRTGANASSTDGATWATFAEARVSVTRFGLAGVGYVFAADDPYVGVDLDHCRDPQTGDMEDWAQEIVNRLCSYTEASQSGTGLHVIVTGNLPDGWRKCGPLEMYSAGRFFVMTGAHLDGTAETIEERSTALAELQARYAKPAPEERTAAPSPTLADRELLVSAFRAKNGVKIEALYHGDVSGYPSASEADLALCSLLAFYASGPDQIDHLFRGSGLMRGKWDERHGPQTYGQLTISKALAGRTASYSANGAHRDDAHGVGDRDDVRADADGHGRPDRRTDRGDGDAHDDAGDDGHDDAEDRGDGRGDGHIPHLHAERLDDLLEREDLPLDAIIADGGEGAVLTTDGKMVVAGPTGIGKTNMLLRMARCLCAGEPWLGLGVPKPRTVLYLLLEGSPRATRKRLRKIWCDAPEDARERFHIGHVSLDLSNEDCVLALHALLEDVRPDVLVIDPLRNAHPGDENASNEMAKLTRMLDAIAHRHGLALALAHHDRKRPPFVRRDGGTDRLRGSTAFTGWLSAALSIDVDPSGPDRITAEWVKTRDAEAPLDRLALDFDRETIDFYPTERAPEGKVSDEAILTTVFQAGGTIRGVDLVRGFIEGAGVGERWLRERVRSLVRSGKLAEYIAECDRQTRAKSYSIPPETDE